MKLRFSRQLATESLRETKWFSSGIENAIPLLPPSRVATINRILLSSHLQVLKPLPDPLRFPQQDLSLLHQRQRDCEIALLVYQLDFLHLEENKRRGWSGVEDRAR